MVFSNEPAVYDVENGFGIRLENMLLSIPYGKGELAFENLTFIPFDGRLVDFDMLTTDEKNWLRSYHKQILIDVFPQLKQKTREILMQLMNCFLWGVHLFIRNLSNVKERLKKDCPINLWTQRCLYIGWQYKEFAI